MTEPTIICPNCKTEIKLTESLAAPLIESTRKQFEQQLAQKDADVAKREQAMREKEKQLADELDDTIQHSFGVAGACAGDAATRGAGPDRS